MSDKLKNLQIDSRIGTQPREAEAMEWAKHQQQEIDALRSGQAMPSGLGAVWNGVKGTWREGMLDLREMGDKTYGFGSTKDADAIRNKALEMEKKKAIQDFQNKDKEGYLPYETSGWENIRKRGQY